MTNRRRRLEPDRTLGEPETDFIDNERRMSLVEELGIIWATQGGVRMDGRVFGYLLMSNAPYVSSVDLGRALQVSTGSVSTATRSLIAARLIKRVARSGERAYCFALEDDITGALLARERAALASQERFARDALAQLGIHDQLPRQRLVEIRDYLEWLTKYHERVAVEWELFKRTRRRAVGRPWQDPQLNG